MKLKTLLLMLVAVPTLGYALVYAYVWLQTKWGLDRLAEQIAPVAELRYGGIGVGPTGTIAVRDLIVSPLEAGDSIRIDRVEVTTPGIETILKGSAALREGKLPERLGLALRGIRIDPNGPLWQAIGGGNAGEEPRPTNGLACNIAGIVTRAGILKSLTPAQILMDVEELLEPGADPGTASIRLKVRERGYGDVDLDMLVARLPERLGTSEIAPTLTALSARLSLDATYARKALELCAKASGLTDDQILPRLLAQEDTAYVDDIGMIPGPGIRDLLRGLLTGKAVEAHIDMPAGLDPASIRRYRPVDVPQLLSLQVSLNGSPVTDLSFVPGPRSATPAARPTSATEAGSPAEDDPSARPADPVDISFAELTRCLDCSVLITLRDGRERRGTVDGTRDGIVYLKTQLQQGSMISEVRAAETAKILLLGPWGKNREGRAIHP